MEEQDKTVDCRFQVVVAVKSSNLSRIKGKWSTAKLPLGKCNTGFPTNEIIVMKIDIIEIIID